MSRYGDFYENKVTGERAVVLRGDEDGHGQSALVHLTAWPHGSVVGEHIHPQLKERFRVISGRLGTRIDGVEIWPPDPRFELMIGNMFGPVNAGKTNAKGMPGMLQLAVIGREFQDVMRFTRPPHPIQTVMFGLLGPIGRIRGYRGIYPEYSHPHGRTKPDPAVLAIAGLAPPDIPTAGGEA